MVRALYILAEAALDSVQTRKSVRPCYTSDGTCVCARCVYGKRDKIQAVVGGLHNFSLRSAPNRKATATDNGNNNRKRNIFLTLALMCMKSGFHARTGNCNSIRAASSLLCTGQVFMCAHLLAVR